MLAEKTCPSCNADMENECRFCSSCGYDFTQGTPNVIAINDRRIEGYLTADIESFVDKRDDVYTAKFEAVEQKQITFNWCAFLFMADWFAYRRMYGWAVGIILTSVLIGIGIAAVLITPLTNSMISAGMFTFLSFGSGLVLRVICGFLGDRIYWNRIKKALDLENCKERPPVYDSKLKQRLGLAGGTSVPAVVISVVAGEIFIQLVTAFVTPAITNMLL